MALIGKIREKSALLLIFIGVAMAAFVLGDMFKGGGGAQYSDLGEIFGETIDVEAFEKKILAEENKLISQGITNYDKSQLRDQVWYSMLSEMIMEKEFAGVGVNVSSAELSDLILGKNIHPQVLSIPFFQDSLTQAYSQNQAVSVYGNVNTNPQLKAWWNSLEANLRKIRQVEKYAVLIQKGLYANSAEAQKDYASANENVSYRYVVKMFNDIADSTISFSDEELKAKYNELKNKKEFEQKESRDIEYIMFPIVASDEDKRFAENRLNDLLGQFKESTTDSVFVMRKSDTKFFNPEYKDPASFPAGVDSLLLAADSGAVVGPYYNEVNNAYKLLKVLDTRMEKEARVRHILIKGSTPEEFAAAKIRIDSIKRVYQAQRNWDDLVLLSEDVASVPNGGVYEWFAQGKMVEEFWDASINTPVNGLKVVKTTYGYHLVNVLGQREAKRIRLAEVDKLVLPLKETKAEAYEKALRFAIANNTAEKFEAKADEEGLVRVTAERITPEMEAINSLQNARKLVKWTYQAEMGDVAASPFEMGTVIVVPRLVLAREDGAPSFEDLKMICEIKVRQDKKAAKFEAELAGATSIEELASKSGLTVETQASANFANPLVGALGNQPAVTGTACAYGVTGKLNILLVPICDNAGVFVIVVDTYTAAPAATDLAIDQEQLTGSRRSRVDASAFYQSDVFKALEDNANIKDYRARVNLLNY